MKTKKLLFLFILVIFFSCVNKKGSAADKTKASTDVNKKDTVGSKFITLPQLKSIKGLSYDESLTKWGELKNLNGNSYIYKTTFLSWAEFGSITELKIKQGKVISRIYKEFKTTKNSHEITDSYTETASDLGRHEKGASPLTIDELYKLCAKKYLIADKKNNTLYFETGLNGLMTLCGFVPNGCQDDCFQGISINYFEWIK